VESFFSTLGLCLLDSVAYFSIRRTQMDREVEALRLLGGTSVPAAELTAFIEETLGKAGVTGLSCAIINGGQGVYREAFGDRNATTGARQAGQADYEALLTGAGVAVTSGTQEAYLQNTQGRSCGWGKVHS
jgi:hypothetical protein